MHISARVAVVGGVVLVGTAIAAVALTSGGSSASTSGSRGVAANACTEYQQAAFLHDGKPADAGSKVLHLNRAQDLAKQAAAADSHWSTLSADISSYIQSTGGGGGPATNVQEFAASLKGVVADCSAAGVTLQGS
jgi:hypothetical protein